MSEYMYDTLYLTEKDSQVEALCPVLGCRYDRKWNPAYNHEKKIAIVPLQGHLLALKQFPHDYDPSYKDWNDSTVLCFPPVFEKIPQKRTVDLLNRAVDHIKKSKKIILATDFDNEGAALAMSVIEYAGASDRVERMLEMGSMDENALRDTIEHPINIPFREMATAGFARACIDWAEGMTYSRAFSMYLGKGKVVLPFGGVKSPVLQMIVERDLAFEQHSSIKFWHLSGTASFDGKDFDFTLYRKGDGKDIKDSKTFDVKDAAEKVKDLLKEATVTSFSKKVRKEGPEALYVLSSLSAEMARKENLTQAETTDVGQSNYDIKKIQTYIRTGIQYLKETEYDAVPTILKEIQKIMFKKEIEEILSGSIPKRKSVFNTKEVTSHGGIIPVNAPLEAKYNSLTKLEKSMFDVVCQRYVENFMPDYEFEEIEGKADINDTYFITFKENRPLRAGFKALSDDGKLADKIKNYQRIIPDVKKGDIIKIKSVSVNEGETKPKPRFDGTTLPLALEKIKNIYPDDPLISEFLGKNGIGAPSTRGEHIEELFGRSKKKPLKEGEEPFLKMQGKWIVSTQRARDLVKYCPKEILSPVRRAKMNQLLVEIEKGNLSYAEIMKMYKESLIKDIEYIKELGTHPENIVPISIKKDVEVLGECPLCKSGQIVEKDKAYICSNAAWKKEGEKWINSGCNYTIHKNSFERFGKKTISKLDVMTMLKTGSVEVSLMSKANQPYKKKAVVDLQWGAVIKFKDNE